MELQPIDIRTDDKNRSGRLHWLQTVPQFDLRSKLLHIASILSEVPVKLWVEGQCSVYQETIERTLTQKYCFSVLLIGK
jgi:hypothetical protein